MPMTWMTGSYVPRRWQLRIRQHHASNKVFCGPATATSCNRDGRWLRVPSLRGDEWPMWHVMTDGSVEESGLPPWARNVRHACPRCRTAIELTERGDSCPSCGFRVTIDRGVYRCVIQAARIQYWQDTYDAVATGALSDTSPGMLYSSPVQQRVAAFRQLCGEFTAGERILDVGCANGMFWEALLDRKPAFGVDFSLEMCVLARARGMVAYHADALCLPFADDQFDL